MIDFTYYLENIALDWVDNFTDLGVIVTKDLTWSMNINSCIKKTMFHLAYVKRTLGFDVCMEIKKLCFTVLVRWHVEYATCFGLLTIGILFFN